VNFFKRAVREKITKQAMLDSMLKNLYRNPPTRDYSRDEAKVLEIIKMEMLPQDEFDFIFNPGHTKWDGALIRLSRQFKTRWHSLIEKTQVL
jgi:hypothetical protein